MELMHHLALGFGVAFAPLNLLLAVLACLLGTLVGLLPGIGPVAAMALLLPACYALAPVSMLVVLMGVYCGAQHGRATAAILQGQMGATRLAVGLGSFFAASLGLLALLLLTPMLAGLALQLGPTETLALAVLGLVACMVLASGSLLKALAMALLGLLLGLVGTDAPSGVQRFALDIPELGGGIGFAVLAMGVCGYGEIISNLGQPPSVRPAPHGVGAAIAVLALLGLGLPSNAAMALLVGALDLHHIPAGPQVLASQPGLYWGLLVCTCLACLLPVPLNLGLLGLWRWLLRVPYRWLFAALVLLGAVGAYSLHHRILDIWLVALFGLLGYGFNKLGLQSAPLLLGFVLAPGMEDSLRRTLQLSHGDWSVLVMRPLSASMLLLALALLLLVVLPAFKTWRAAVLATG